MNATTSVRNFGIKQVIRYLDSNPQRSMPKIVHWAEKLDKGKKFNREITDIKHLILDENSNWHRFADSLFTEIGRAHV